MWYVNLYIIIDCFPWAVEEDAEKYCLTNNDAHSREKSSIVDEWCIDQGCKSNEEEEKHRQLLISMIL